MTNADRNRAAATALFACAGLVGAAGAQPDPLWIEQFGTAGHEDAQAAAPDGEGGVFVAGWTMGSLGGPNQGAADAFLGRCDADGQWIFTVQIGSTGYDEFFALAPDGHGGVFVAGSTTGLLGAQSFGGKDMVLAHYDGKGNQIWIRQFGTSAEDEARALAPAVNGGVFVAGDTKGNLGGPNAGGEDIALAHFFANGNQIWIKQIGTSARDSARALAPDGGDGVFVAGLTQGALGGPNAGATDVFLARYDLQSNQVWNKQFGSASDDEAFALASDGSGGVFVAGPTYGALGGQNAGASDMFLARYDAGGGRAWITELGTPAYEEAKALTPDGRGGVFLAGMTAGSLDEWNPEEDNDTYLALFDSTGYRLRATQLGSDAADWAFSLAPDGAGSVFMCGSTWGKFGDSAFGGNDAFVMRYGPTGQAPIANDDDAGCVPPESVWIDIFGNDSDPNGDTFSLVWFDKQTKLGGSVVEQGGGLLYSPPKQYGVDYFTYGIADNDGEDSALVTVHLLDPAHFREPEDPGPAKPGLTASYYVAEGFGKLPDFGLLKPYLDGTVPEVDFLSTDGDFAGSKRADEVGAVFTGYLVVPKTDLYTLYTESDDGSRLKIGKNTVVDNDGLHAMVEAKGQIGLKAGAHMIGIEFFENFGGAGLIASIEGGGVKRQPIPPEMLVYGVACAPDLDQNGKLDLFDFLEFVNLFNAQKPEGDCDGNGVYDLFDFLCFVNLFNEGC